MVNKNDETSDKKQNSVDEITKRIDSLSSNIRPKVNDDWVAVLLEGKSPQYYKRFAAWARKNLESSYQKDMIEAMVSVYAMNVLTKRSQFTDEFVAGQANALLFMFEEMERLSNVTEFNINK